MNRNQHQELSAVSPIPDKLLHRGMRSGGLISSIAPAGDQNRLDGEALEGWDDGN
jgi:hypothetical protein